jgi:hypothetical protein
VSLISDPKLEAVLQRAIDDWNVLFREKFGVKAFFETRLRMGPRSN